MGLMHEVDIAAIALGVSTLTGAIEYASGSIARLVMRVALRTTPGRHRDRLKEEWAAHLLDTPHLFRIFVAIGFLMAGVAISRHESKMVGTGKVPRPAIAAQSPKVDSIGRIANIVVLIVLSSPSGVLLRAYRKAAKRRRI